MRSKTMTSYSEVEATNKVDKTVLSTKEARQGDNAGVLYVLIASALGAIVGLAYVGYYNLS